VRNVSEPAPEANRERALTQATRGCQMAQAKLILSDPTRDEMLTALAQSSADEFDIEAATNSTLERFVEAFEAVLALERVTNIRTSEQKRSPHQSRTSS